MAEEEREDIGYSAGRLEHTVFVYYGGRNPWAARADGAVTHAGAWALRSRRRSLRRAGAAVQSTLSSQYSSSPSPPSLQQALLPSW